MKHGAPQDPSGDAAPPLRVGLSSVVTTPDKPVWLYGYASQRRQTPFEGKMHDLYAKAIAFEDEQGAKSVLVTVDLCVLRKPEAERVLSRIAERTGLPHERIIVNLSHTHSGPIIGEEDPNRFPMPPEMRERVRAYTDKLVERLAEAAVAALEDLRPAKVSWGRGQVGFVRNRRLLDEQGRYRGMKPYPDGFTDPRVTVLRVDEPDGAPRAYVCSLACHAVTLGDKNLKLCGDYPGFAKALLEERWPGTQALFVQGCGADANSHPRSTPDQMEWAQRQGGELAQEVERVANGPLAPVRGPIRAAHTWLDLPLRRMAREEMQEAAEGPSYQSHNPKRMLEMLDRGQELPASYRTPVGVWRFGEDLTLVALPGETVSGFIPRMEEIFGAKRLWVAGYCNEVFGYLPTARIVEEGGYEDRGLVREVGLFDASAEEMVVEGVRRLAEKVGVAPQPTRAAS